MIMHPHFSALDRPEWYEQGGLSNYTDSQGTHIFSEFLNIAKSDGGGFIEHYWPTLDEVGSQETPKITYIQFVPEWDWILGTGFFTEELDSEINVLRNTGIVLVLGLIILTVLLSYLLARDIGNPIATITLGA